MRGTVAEDMKFISDSLCHPSEMRLLFRASEHQFAAEAFHSKCDGINDTFVLVRTEFGKTICGYTHYKWNEWLKKNLGSNYVIDSGRRAFLLLMEQQQKVVPQIDAGIIVCDNGWGPYFGGYYGWNPLKICDNCNSEANSTSIRFGGQYNTEGTDRNYGCCQ